MPDRSFLSWPFFEARHRDLAERLDAWCAKNLPVAHDDVDAACRALVAMLGRDGWLKPTAIDTENPEPLDVRALCIARETLARHDGLADFAFAMQGLGTGAISLFGTPEQQQWLDQTRAGEKIAAFALSESRSGSDVANMEMIAERDGDSYLLFGEKTWISNGGITDFYVVFARTGEAAGAKGLSAFIVPAESPGLSVAERLETIAPHPLARLAFEKVRVSASALIGRPGDGFRIAMSVLDVFRSTVGAAALGFARRALDESIERVATRKLFGAPMAELQMVQGHIADMALDVDAAALLVYRAAWTKDMGAARVTREAAMAKLFATDRAQTVIDRAVQLHGGDGVRRGHIVESLYREIRALRIYEGASDVQKVVIARQVLATSGTHGSQRERGTAMTTDLLKGITAKGDGFDGVTWNILGQTYFPKAVCETTFAFETNSAPGQFVPVHIHPDQDEFILVQEGQLELKLDGVWSAAKAGDLVRMPRGVPHGYFNKSDRPCRALFWVSPAGRLKELFEKLHNQTDIPTIIKLSAEHDVEFLPEEANA